MKIYYSTDYNSPIGRIFIAGDEDSISGLWFYSQKYFKSTIKAKTTPNDNLAIFMEVKRWLDDYFNGLNPEINFTINPQGSEFRKKVWKILSQIPYGKTMTYGEIASMISSTMSARAVGGAVGANPIAILIPCHRVLGKNRRLTGYAAGIDKKIRLLEIEGVL